MRNTYEVLVGKPAEKRLFGRHVDGRILEWILKKLGEREWVRSLWLNTGTSDGMLRAHQ
jgi:hypothetical protein